MYDRININTPYFIVFCRGCCIENEKNTDMSWAGNAFENDKLQHNYELDCNETFTDGEEHELWWNLSCKLDWYLHEFLELRILEVDSNEL